MSFARARIIRVLLLCGLAAALLPLPALAGSTKPQPCWVLLLNESYSGHITTIYAPQCYTEAEKHIPPIAKIYGNELQEIQQAAAAAKLGKLPKNPTGGDGTAGGRLRPRRTTAGSGRRSTSSIRAARTRSRLPLIVLGALAVLLVIAGIAGMFWQRSHPRESGPPAAS